MTGSNGGGSGRESMASVMFCFDNAKVELNETKANKTKPQEIRPKNKICRLFFLPKESWIGMTWAMTCHSQGSCRVTKLSTMKKAPISSPAWSTRPLQHTPLFAFQRIFTNPHVSHEAWFIWFVLNWHLNYIILYWFIWQFMTIHNDMNSNFVDIFPIREAFPPGLTEYAIQKVQTPCAHNFNGSNPTSQPTQDFSGVNFINQRIFIREKQTRTRVSHSLHSLGQFKTLSSVWPIMLLNDCMTPSISHQPSEVCAIGEHQRIKIGSWQKSWHQKHVWFQI